MPGRTPPDDACRCSVAGCHRWTQGLSKGQYFLCCDHWGRLTRMERAMLRRLWRRIRALPDEVDWWSADNKRWRLRYLRTWRIAIKRAS
jgi:hypothetical protein